MKTLKFKEELVPLVLSGVKNSTWRLFDDKDLQEGDKIALINKSTLEQFGKALIVFVQEKKLGEIGDSDFEGHNGYESEEKMYEDFKKYYGDQVTSDSVLKIIRFKLKS
jgi:hypothetical protein